MARLRALSDAAAISGIGETPYSRGSGMSLEETYVRVALEAIDDAGLVPSDIDGVMMPSHTALPSGILETFLDITPSFSGLVNVGGASAASLVLNAALLVTSGIASNVLCITARNDSSAGRRQRQAGAGRTTVAGFAGLEVPYGWVQPPAVYAMQARHHIATYGTPTTEQLGSVAVTMRQHALLNEHAQMRDPITLADHANSRLIAEPFRLLDCCIISDGGAAAVVTTAERARDGRHTAALLGGFGQGHPRSPGDLVNRPDIEELGLSHAAETAFAMAEMTPQDIDVAEIYDCFTYVVIKQLELLGYCEPGEGGAFAAEGRIGLTGQLPVNTHGGLLSQGHMSGMNHIVEAVRQVRGAAGAAQVPEVSTALVTGYGHLNVSSILIVRS